MSLGRAWLVHNLNIAFNAGPVPRAIGVYIRVRQTFGALQFSHGSSLSVSWTRVKLANTRPSLMVRYSDLLPHSQQP